MSHVEPGLIQAYIDGALDEAQAQTLESHVAGCDSCARLFEDEAEVHAAAAAIMADAVDAEVPEWDALVERAGAPAAPKLGHEPAAAFAWRPALAWAATLVMAFAVGWGASRGFLDGEPGVAVERRLSPAAVPPAAPGPAAGGEREEADSLESAPPATAVDETTTARPGAAPATSEETRAGAAALADGRVAGGTGEEPDATTDRLLRVADAETTTGAGVRAQADEVSRLAEAEARLTELDGRATTSQSADAAAARRMAPEQRARQKPARTELQAMAPPSPQASPAESVAADAAQAGAWEPLAFVPLAMQPEPHFRGRVPATDSALADHATGDVLRLDFTDPASGAELTLWQGQAADRGERDSVAGLDAAVLTVRPDGTRALRWFTRDGVVLLLESDAPEQTLRAVAAELR